VSLVGELADANGTLKAIAANEAIKKLLTMALESGGN